MFEDSANSSTSIFRNGDGRITNNAAFDWVEEIYIELMVEYINTEG